MVYLVSSKGFAILEVFDREIVIANFILKLSFPELADLLH